MCGGVTMEFMEWFANRLSQLRMQKGVSSRDMSLSLGQSASYINKIENRRTLPSMTGFLYICEYLKISPKDFFDDGITAPQKVDRITAAAQKLSPSQADHVLSIILDITND